LTETLSDVGMHQTQVTDNVARMIPIPELDIPANSVVTIAPGSYHIMLNDIRYNLVEGETITIVLDFASGAQINALVPITEQGKW